MKLKKLEIHGFKSFDQKASIQFPSGVSAIVGPNGCGKSNLMDALRWVMGEQSVKQLRGKSMEDIIFAGANGKAPQNMAEVSLTLINDNGSAPEELKDFSEIMLTRRLFRSGESAYYINKQQCRLKDINNIFMGSGMGAKSYAVIQQGNIGAITDAGPEERRFFIEEAAGVTRFISRKNEALRKVQSTNNNLMRISDIISEVNRQMNSLKRQAKKAELYNKYQNQIKAYDVHLAIHYIDHHTARIHETEKLIESLKDTDIGHSTQLKKLNAAIERIKQQRWQKNQEISDQKNRRFETQRRIDRTENDLAHFRQDIKRLSQETAELESAQHELEQKNESVQVEMTQVKSQNGAIEQNIRSVRTDIEHKAAESQGIRDRLKGLDLDLDSAKKELMEHVAREARYKNIYQNASHNRENLQRRLKQADEEAALAERKTVQTRQQELESKQHLETARRKLEAIDKRIDDVKSRLDTKSGELGRQVKTVQTIDFERNKIRSQYTALKKMEENFDWYKEGVQVIMKRKGVSGENASGTAPAKGIIGLMADIVEPAPTYETAVEAALGESLQYILVEDQASGLDAIAYLTAESTGRSGFIPVSAVKNLSDDPRRKPDSSSLLLNHIKVKPEYESIAAALLGHVVLAENISEALKIHNRNGVMQTIVTRNGDIVSPQGIIIGGSKENLSGILKKKQELRALEKQIDESNRQFESARAVQVQLEQAVKELEKVLHELTGQKHQASQDEIEAEKVLYKISEELKHATRHLEIVRLEQEQLLGEESDVEAEIVKYDRALNEISKDVVDAQNRVAGLSEKISSISTDLETFNQQNVDLKLKLTSLNARLESNNNSLARLEEYRREGLHRCEQTVREIEQKIHKKDALDGQSKEYEQSLAGMYEEIKHLEQKLESNESDYLAIDNQLKENDGIISSIQGKREETLQKIRLLEVELSQQQIKQENIKTRMEELYRQAFADLKKENRSVDPALLPPDMGIEEMEATLAKARDKAARIIDVNLGAIREYEELKVRYDFLVEQRDDLVKAIEDLHKVIRKINQITKKRFLETFEQINAKLSEVFPRLFEGGTATLVLTEPDKPLETGVEFMVHPPGKKLTRLTLLSGGEKALSAIAFIFSIFLIKPASFCLMDEIDAPLDEVNVFRFNDLLKIIGEKSQIVMVTHNKKTMEFADMLFGVTMENKGVSKIVSVSMN